MQRGRTAALYQEFRDVEADAAGTHNRHALANRHSLAENVDVAKYFRVVLSFDFWIARHDAGRDDYTVISFCF